MIWTAPGLTWRRMQIPDGIPPSFKGTSVQYVYTLEAHAALSDDSLVRVSSTTPSD